MLSVEEAQKNILSTLSPLGPESIDLARAHGRVLAEEVAAGEDMPPFDNTAMDGFAVRALDTVSATGEPRRLKVRYTLPAGSVGTDPIGPGEAARIMTGAPIPPGTDAVVQVEWTRPDPQDADAVWVDRPVNPGQNIRRRGGDMRRGSPVLTSGQVVTPPVVGILATVGKIAPNVYRRPRVAIIATGDELVDPSPQPLRPGTIRNSNSYALAAAAERAGGVARIFPPSRDRLEDIERMLDRALAESDMVVSSGGVSVGDFDLVKDVLSRRGQLDFWRVRMKPGKPVAYGNLEGKPFFGLPGNPVSALVTFELFVRPALRVLQGDHEWQPLTLKLKLAEPFTLVDDRRQYVRVRLEVDPENGLVVHPNPSQDSHIQTSWSRAKALMIVGENEGPLSRGETVSVMLLD